MTDVIFPNSRKWNQIRVYSMQLRTLMQEYEDLYQFVRLDHMDDPEMRQIHLMMKRIESQVIQINNLIEKVNSKFHEK